MISCTTTKTLGTQNPERGAFFSWVWVLHKAGTLSSGFCPLSGVTGYGKTVENATMAQNCENKYKKYCINKKNIIMK